MSEAPPTPNAALQPSEAGVVLPSPWRCLGGAIVAGAIAYVLYLLTHSIAQSFATHPIHSSNFTTQRIAAAVRTLVVGMSALGTGIFGLAAFGLFGLGIQTLLQRQKTESPPPENS